MIVAAASAALSAGAQANWQLDRKSIDFSTASQGGRGVMADFNNNGHLDIFVSGAAWNAIYDHPGTWSWQCLSNMYLNNGDGTFTEDIIGTEPTGEFNDTDLDDQGNPKEYYRYVDPKHGIAPTKHGHYITFDYNNDGLVDLLVSGILSTDDHAGYRDRIPEANKMLWPGTDNKWVTTVLYKNLGNGRFEVVDGTNLPIVVSDGSNGEAMNFTTMVSGDYDHDGYTDLAFSGIIVGAEPGEPDRIAQLWRNIDGTGRFEQVNIAETKGGSWTKAVTEGEGDDKVEVLPARELEGWFLLLSGNVTMADINNDGWLDLVFDGWADKVNDGVYEGGSNGRVYLNQEGKKFIDITDPTGMFYLCRSGNTQLVDFNGDGYLDLVNAGYGDHGIGWKTLLFNNNLGDDPEADPETIFNYGESMDQYGLPNHENIHLVARDFDGDGIMDLGYMGQNDSKIYYGDMAGTYTDARQLAIRGSDYKDNIDAFGDLTGNGLVDRFISGYNWVHDNYEEDGLNYREILGNPGSDWWFGKYIYNNVTDAEIEAPVAPENVKATFDADAKAVTVEWDDIDDLNCAYNVVVTTPSGKVMANLPVDPVTGFVKVAEKKNIAIRPFVNKYTLPAPELGEYKLGVQAVSLLNEKSSAIAWAPSLSSVGSISADLNNTTVKVTVNGNTIVANADANAEVKVVDMMGRTIATGVTNTPIAVDAKGVLIVTAAGQSVKVVK